MPADNNLRRGFAVFICQIANDFLIENAFPDLQIGIVAGQDINKIDLLPTDNLRQSLAVLMRKHIEIGMRQFVT